MNVRLIPKLHRFAFSLSFFAFIVGGLPSIALAGGSDCDGTVCPAAEDSLPSEFDLAGSEELGGPVAAESQQEHELFEPIIQDPVAAESVVAEPIAEFVTQEAVPAEPVAEQSIAEEPIAQEPAAKERVMEESAVEEAVVEEKPVTDEAEFSESSVEASATAIATAALASAGVSIEQIVEPFTMVGPYLENSLDSVRRFQSWWETAMAETGQPQPVDANAIQEQLDAIAAQEPLDVEGLGPSVLVDSTAGGEQPSQPPQVSVMAIDLLVGSSPVIATIEEDALQSGIEVTAMNMLVGSSPIIATLEEENYLPYDLSARDLKLWSVFPLSTRPFCVRSHVEEMETSSMWQEFDEVVVSENVTQEQHQSYVCHGSADCLLDQWIWQIETWTAEDSPLWASLAPQRIGHQIATLVSRSNQLLEGAAELFASSWPEVEESKTSEVGQALLARAGAIEASDPVDLIGPVDQVRSVEVQIAEVPCVTDSKY